MGQRHMNVVHGSQHHCSLGQMRKQERKRTSEGRKRKKETASIKEEWMEVGGGESGPEEGDPQHIPTLNTNLVSSS